MRLSRIKEELDDHEEQNPAVQALYRRLDEDDARLDRVLALLDSLSQAPNPMNRHDLPPHSRHPRIRRLSSISRSLRRSRALIEELLAGDYLLTAPAFAE